MKDFNGQWAIQKPHKLFDHVREMYDLKTDTQLAHMLNTRAALISRIRNGFANPPPSLIISVHEQTKIPISKIKELCK